MGFQNNAWGRPKTGDRKQEKKCFFSNGGVFFLDLLSHRRKQEKKCFFSNGGVFFLDLLSHRRGVGYEPEARAGLNLPTWLR